MIPLKISTTELELQDNALIMLDKVSVKQLNDLFQVDRKYSMPYEKDDKVHVNITLEMDLSVTVNER